MQGFVANEQHVVRTGRARVYVLAPEADADGWPIIIFDEPKSPKNLRAAVDLAQIKNQEAKECSE